MDCSKEKSIKTQNFWKTYFAYVYENKNNISNLRFSPVWIAAAHSMFYGNHFGCMEVQWYEKTVRWKFSSCLWGEEDDVCQTHMGFIQGILDSTGWKNTIVSRIWKSHICILEVKGNDVKK